ncbi:NAD-dependent formate dehydrogenase [Tilletiopsis washingtonensis]|uniref:Formate dehydrogenase n=1 Tax=Tilletiopsis washingtonensis TaxID=58919 RepID=A0A316Z748_9BASI|nr:NAD-dependent formate dehydrogenase [Tilletiopsis washingtonensis]PWN97391.1 NAD-dependent formate dehydrogenase [Tilletiopsis washingtonensis]
MVKVLCVLYSGGKHAQEQPRLLGTIENKLGLEQYMKDNGHEFVVTDDKEGPNSVFAKEIVDAEVVITTPFHPGYLTKEIMATAKKLKLCITAGIGSDHIDLDAANEHKLTVAEVTGSNVVSVAEHVIMTILILVRNYNVGHEQVYRSKAWDVAAVAKDSYDLEGKVVGTIGAGRIGYRVLERLLPFNCKELLYYDYQDLPAEAAKKVGARRIEDIKEFLGACDVVTVNAPLHAGTKDLINEETIKYMKDGAWLINTARGAICNAEAVRKAVDSGKLRGYGGDVWNVQPAPADHPWREMSGPGGRGNAMTPHVSGTSIDAQERYAAGTKAIFDNWLAGKPQKPEDLITESGSYATKAYGNRVAQNQEAKK